MPGRWSLRRSESTSRAAGCYTPADCWRLVDCCRPATNLPRRCSPATRRRLARSSVLRASSWAQSTRAMSTGLALRRRDSKPDWTALRTMPVQHSSAAASTAAKAAHYSTGAVPRSKQGGTTNSSPRADYHGKARRPARPQPARPGSNRTSRGRCRTACSASSRARC